MYSGIEIIGTFMMFILLRIILPAGTVYIFSDWVKKNQLARL
jgi:hypothetical protein